MKYLKPFHLFENDDKIKHDFFRKLDFYYLKKDLTELKVKEIYDLIEFNKYRGFATFIDNIEYFKDIKTDVIAIVNYPAIRFTKRSLLKEFDKVKEYDFIDEVEFPWSMKYVDWGVEYWRDIIIDFINKGIKLRPMLEFGIYKDEDIKKVIQFLKQINITTIMTSSGLYPEMTNIEKWNSVKDFIPNKFVVKIGGVLTETDINEFIKNDIDLIATTIEFKTEK